MRNTRLRLVAGAVFIAAVAASGCEVEKSANPLSPAVAGPIEGVVISPPSLVKPDPDGKVSAREQPVQLVIQNAATNGVRPLKYLFEIASDPEFKKLVFARSGVEPGPDGSTRLQVPDKLASTKYWWRARAEDGANTGPYSAAKSFQVLAPVVLEAPIPESPVGGAPIVGIVPAFQVRAGNRSGLTDEVEYTIQVATTSSFAPVLATFKKTEAVPTTRIEPGQALAYSTTYYWRVRAWHTADPADLSSWSATQTFVTAAAPASPPPPQDPGPGGGGGSNPSACNSREGNDIASCIEARYPQYLASGVSLSKRTSNMRFLRDRMIEHAKCRGLDVGLNLKRGGPEISVDFVAWRNGGRLEGVDIASAYDDPRKRLNLMWHRYGPPNYGHPFYKDFGPANCN
jgi:hypothetical protein